MRSHTSKTNKEDNLGSVKQYSDMNENNTRTILNKECTFQKVEEDFLKLITDDKKNSGGAHHSFPSSTTSGGFLNPVVFFLIVQKRYT